MPIRFSFRNRVLSSRRATTRSTMRPTVTHEIPSCRLAAVRSVTCARYAANSSKSDVNTLPPLAHGTRSTFTPHRAHDTRHGAYRSNAGNRPHDRCRHERTGCRSYRGARCPHAPQRERRHDGSTDTVNGPLAANCTSCTYICVTPSSRRSNVVRRMGLSSSSRVVVVPMRTGSPCVLQPLRRRGAARRADTPPSGRPSGPPAPEWRSRPVHREPPPPHPPSGPPGRPVQAGPQGP